MSLTHEQLNELERLYIAATCDDVELLMKGNQWREFFKAIVTHTAALIAAARENERLRAELQAAQDKAAKRMDVICELGDKWSDAVDEVREVETENELDAAAMRKTIGSLRAKIAELTTQRNSAIRLAGYS